ncbi:MAG: hypothetical protein AAFN12_15495, partial [Cyanobacteria bacterium J06560_2]
CWAIDGALTKALIERLNSASIQYDAPDGGTDGGGDGGGNGGGGNGGGGNGGGGNGGGDGGGNGGDGGGTGRVNQLSNSVFYQFQTTATAGVNNAGLGIVKSANKSSAEPGDIVIYTLLVSTVTGDAPTLSVLDDLPDGVEYVDDSANAALVSAGNPEGVPVAFNLTGSENAITFTDFAPGLSQGQQLLIRYATTVSPDGVRGDGINTATASDIQAGLGSVSDTFRLTIRPGILSDCGTILGRVFSDTNFDGLQQPGEPGIPNAVIFMDSGNRIITDADGLFSMGNVISGNRVGALDTSSLNGYTLAPNLYRIEENGQSRLVHLEAGGLARMNFAVTPTFGEGE